MKYEYDYLFLFTTELKHIIVDVWIETWKFFAEDNLIDLDLQEAQRMESEKREQNYKLFFFIFDKKIKENPFLFFFLFAYHSDKDFLFNTKSCL